MENHQDHEGDKDDDEDKDDENNKSIVGLNSFKTHYYHSRKIC